MGIFAASYNLYDVNGRYHITTMYRLYADSLTV